MPRKKDRHRSEGEHFSLDIPFNRSAGRTQMTHQCGRKRLDHGRRRKRTGRFSLHLRQRPWTSCWLGRLNPGESYQFGKPLPLSKYFPEEQEYRVYWKGNGFGSSTITVTVTPKR